MLNVTQLKVGDNVYYKSEPYTIKLIEKNYFTFSHQTDRPIYLSLIEASEALRRGDLYVAPANEQFALPVINDLKAREYAINVMKLLQHFR